MKARLYNTNEQLKLIVPKEDGPWHSLPVDCIWYAPALREGLIDETGRRIDYTRNFTPFGLVLP